MLCHWRAVGQCAHNHGSVATARREQSPVGAEGDARHAVSFVARKRLVDLPRRDIQDKEPIAVAASREMLAVGAERKAHDDAVVTAPRLADRPGGSHVPQDDRFVTAAGRQESAVGAERQARTLIGMSLQPLAGILWPWMLAMFISLIRH
jgi:hypothetical protein